MSGTRLRQLQGGVIMGAMVLGELYSVLSYGVRSVVRFIPSRSVGWESVSGVW